MQLASFMRIRYTINPEQTDKGQNGFIKFFAVKMQYLLKIMFWWYEERDRQNLGRWLVLWQRLCTSAGNIHQGGVSGWETRGFLTDITGLATSLPSAGDCSHTSHITSPHFTRYVTHDITLGWSHWWSSEWSRVTQWVKQGEVASDVGWSNWWSKVK